MSTKSESDSHALLDSTSPRVAVVGIGRWGKNLARNFSEIGALRLVCDQNTARAAELQTNYPDVEYSADFGAVVGRDDVEAVVLASPAGTHYEMARQALEAGKDCYVEKPLALCVTEGHKLVELAAEHGRILMVGHILQYHPAVVRLKELVDSGELGAVRYVYSNRLNMGTIRAEENILWSFAPHDVSVLLGLLREEPCEVTCQGGAYINPLIPDVTMSQFLFPSGVRAHIHVSWLHPFREQRLVVIGSEKMAVFDDLAENKLVLFPHHIQWRNRVPTAVKAEAEVVGQIGTEEPLRAECEHFLECVRARKQPYTDGEEGLRVLRVLEACQHDLLNGVSTTTSSAGVAAKSSPASNSEGSDYFIHKTAVVEADCKIGPGTKIWHFSHVVTGARIGRGCVLGQNCSVAGGVVIGDNVKVQNNVSVYEGTEIEDDVFLGPSCVLTNVTNPRSQVRRRGLYERTLLRRGATIGANATVVCGVEVGRYAFVAAGAVVTRDVPDYGLVVGNPARTVGWMSRHGHRLAKADGHGIIICPESGYRYEEKEAGVLRCLDLDEDAPLPPELAEGKRSYGSFKNN